MLLKSLPVPVRVHALSTYFAVSICGSHCSNQIDILVFYTTGGLASIGLTTQAQMESFVIEEFEATNEAMVNSLIDLEMLVVRVQPVRQCFVTHEEVVQYQLACAAPSTMVPLVIPTAVLAT